MWIGIDASRTTVARRTGTEAYSLHLIRALLRTSTEHRFRLYFNAPPPPGLVPGDPTSDATHWEQRVLSFPWLWTHFRLSTEMLLHPPDVLFVPSHVLPLVHPRRSVVTVHDLGHYYHPEAHTARQRRYLEWSTRYHVRTAARLVADSQVTKDDLVRLYGADPARVTVVHLGVDRVLKPVRDAQRMASVLHKYGITAPYALYVGTLQPRKNLLRLIQAWEQVASGELGSHEDGQPVAQLVLAGKEGWLSGDILKRARVGALQGRIVLSGYVEGVDLASLYSGASLFVMPSLYEGFCMPVLEAMACGTPVVCSNVSSLPEVVGDAALTFDPHDLDSMAAAIQDVLGDAELRRAMVVRGYERAASFTWAQSARKVLSVLESVGRTSA
jgi:glycosyltransferase involved in cell wall biosynthesis